MTGGATIAPLPPRVLTWYGDDFTGSTDVLEVLALAGLAPVLFLTLPDAEALAAFPEARAVGLAGISRARDPEWMSTHLPPAFAALASLGAPLLHYKVCSTFDSSPAIGSIGRALELGRHTVGAMQATPIVVGAPALKRYMAFGHLFAAVDDVAYRIDRHPTMAQHPVTPMQEADLVRHLAQQTSQRIGLLDLVALKSHDFRHAFQTGARQTDALFVDVLDDETVLRTGALLWDNVRDIGFCVGSSGIEYALTSYWRAMGVLPAAMSPAPLPEVAQILSVSGSCSPGTAEQIAAAERAGHLAIALDASALLDGDAAPALTSAHARAAAAVAAGRSVVVHTARGPDDPAIAVLRGAAATRGLDAIESGRRVGRALGTLLRQLLLQFRLSRVVVAGGDTSGEVTRILGLRALTMRAAMAPGSPVCLAWAPGPFDGLEIVLKGGQVGGPDLFENVRRGCVA